MGFADDIRDGVADVLSPAWDTRTGQVVPKTADVKLSDGAVKVDATYLYADLGKSSVLGQKIKNEVAAKVIRSYLNAATRVLTHYDGEIRSFDGDRVMAIFIGGSKNSSAVKAALVLNWAVKKVLREKFESKWPDLKNTWSVHHGVGIATGKAMLVRGGVRNNNDLISVGAAPNVAAKLSELRAKPDVYITRAVYTSMEENRRTTNGENMWSDQGRHEIGGKFYQVFGSTWTWSP